MKKILMSYSPDGRRYEIPTNNVILEEFRLIETRAREYRNANKKIVVVQGLGFVGCAVAAAIANARDRQGTPLYLVIGIDLSNESSYWKIGSIKDGVPPISSSDEELKKMTYKGVKEEKNLCATSKPEVYSLADVIVVDIPLNVRERIVENSEDIEIDLESFKNGIKVIGRYMKEDALVIIETTVPVGSTELIIRPILLSERENRKINSSLYLAHAYERVMPGPNYVSSINRFWRTFSGVDEDSAIKANEFLSSFIDIQNYPLWQMSQTSSSELAKLLENSYRATNIAFIYEWTLFAERIGIDLFEVIDSIRVRKGTHDNIRYPGFGVGGYCLTKDELLAQWSLKNLFHDELKLGMTLDAVRINYHMPLHSLDLMTELLDGDVTGKKIVVCGVTYLAEVPDTRNSPTELLVDTLIENGADIIVHDPTITIWPEKPQIHIENNIGKAFEKADGIVFAIPHKLYLELEAIDIIEKVGRPAAIVDAQNILNNDKAWKLHDNGCRLAGVGKGHWRKAELQCR